MRRAIQALLLLFLVSTLTVPWHAHSGGTDENGGHYDSSTGEYHYHHGYPAHDHEDLDGDGTLDCPYNFVDKTGQSSGMASTSKTPEQPINSKDDEPRSNTLLYCLIACIPLFALGCYIIKQRRSESNREVN